MENVDKIPNHLEALPLRPAEGRPRNIRTAACPAARGVCQGLGKVPEPPGDPLPPAPPVPGPSRPAAEETGGF